jgi:hypothetical protein
MIEEQALEHQELLLVELGHVSVPIWAALWERQTRDANIRPLGCKAAI